MSDKVVRVKKQVKMNKGTYCIPSTHQSGSLKRKNTRPRIHQAKNNEQKDDSEIQPMTLAERVSVLKNLILMVISARNI